MTRCQLSLSWDMSVSDSHLFVSKYLIMLGVTVKLLCCWQSEEAVRAARNLLEFIEDSYSVPYNLVGMSIDRSSNWICCLLTATYLLLYKPPPPTKLALVLHSLVRVSVSASVCLRLYLFVISLAPIDGFPPNFCRMLTTLENLENSENFLILENSGNFKFTRGIFVSEIVGIEFCA